jgi:hypothetical protein
MRRFSLAVLLSFAALGAVLGCGSSNSKEADASAPDLALATPDLRPTTMDSSAPDAWLSPDSATDSLAIPDVNVVSDASVTSDLPSSPDLSSPDLAAAGADRSAADLGVADQGGADTGSKDTGGAEVGGDAADSEDAASPADAAFDPGPTVPIVVNSGNTATFNLGDGKWQRFSFPAEAGQIYAISELSGMERGYVSAQATVSPTSFTYQTDATTGRLTFTTSAAGTYYIAVAVVGGGASGSFQVADGGKLLALGATSLTLTAPNAEDFYFFRFPVGSGKGYHLKVTGPVQPNVGLAVSARAERSNYGEFAYSDFGIGGSLPFDEDITADKVAASLSGYYYFYLNLHGDMTLTVTISELP